MSGLILKILAAALALGPIHAQAQTVVWPFLQIGNLVEGVFVAIPYWGVKLIVSVFFIGLAITPFFLPKEYIYIGAGDRKLWKDIRIWACAAAVSELIVYLYF